MKPEERAKLLSRMELMLSQCRRHIKLAEISASLRDGLTTFVSGLLVIAAIFLLVRLLGQGLHMPFILDSVHALLVALAFGVVVFGRALLMNIFGRPVHVTAAAERLDLSQSTHNRIATAIALVRANDDSPFAAVAIREGCEHLERLQSEKPQVEQSVVSWRRNAVLVAVSLAMVAFGQWLGSAPGAGWSSPAELATNSIGIAEVLPDAAVPESKGKPEPRKEPHSQQRLASQPPKPEHDADHSQKGMPTVAQQKAESSGPIAQNAAGKARSGQSSSSRSSSSSAGVKAEADKNDPSKPKASAKPPSKPAATQPQADKADMKGGSIDAQGSSGVGSMRATQNDWSNKVKGKSSDNDEPDNEAEPEENANEEKSRIGVQPALASRASQVSRELSLGMDSNSKKKNESNRGRGGPGGQKKARGTATMIMGVPVPGFVKGSLMPGPTKSTQEEVTPSPREGQYAHASALQPLAAQEVPVERYRPDAGTAQQARDYLITSHADHENKAPNK